MILSFVDIVLLIVYFLVLYLTVFWLLTLFDKKEQKKIKWKKLPPITVLIPAYNEEATIKQTLNSVIKLDYPRLQIIAINDGSKDKTKEIIKDFIKRNKKFDIKLINQENKGKAAALNNALKQTRGKFYASLDADSYVHPKALKKMLPYFYSKKVAAVLPLLKVKDPKNLLQKVQRYEYIINMFYKSLNSKLDCVHVTPGPFSLYRTNVIKNLGGYDENNITEDLEIAIRLQKHHYKIIQTKDAEVYTIAPSNIKELFNQRNRWYKGSVLNTLKYRKLIFKREYGDFGWVRLPTIILGGALSIIILTTIVFDLLKKLINYLFNLSFVNFDVYTFVRNYSFNFNILDLSYVRISIAAFLITLGIFVMIYSHKFSNEKITRYSKTFFSLAYYMLLYSIFLSVVWFMIGIDILRGKVQKW